MPKPTIAKSANNFLIEISPYRKRAFDRSNGVGTRPRLSRSIALPILNAFRRAGTALVAQGAMFLRRTAAALV